MVFIHILIYYISAAFVSDQPLFFLCIGLISSRMYQNSVVFREPLTEWPHNNITAYFSDRSINDVRCKTFLQLRSQTLGPQKYYRRQ